LSAGFIGSQPDRCVPDWQYNAADSGSNASVSCAPGIPAFFQKQKNIHKIIQLKNYESNTIQQSNAKSKMADEVEKGWNSWCTTNTCIRTRIGSVVLPIRNTSIWFGKVRFVLNQHV
jgi:hypothetical protein